jgi:hypothetical protein
VNGAWAFVALLAVGCGSKGAVAIVAAVENPSASVSPPSPLAAVLNGTFTLHVELGQVAPSSTDVSLQGGLNLVRVSDKMNLAALRLTSTPPPPYHLDPGAHVDATVTIADTSSAPGQMIPKTTRDAICQSPTVSITGSLSDSASGAPTPVASANFDVTGCP